MVGAALQRKPVLDNRWTRVCFCGQEVEGGRVDDHSEVGQPFLTGSEEGRGPLYDQTHVNHEGDRLPADVGPHGYLSIAAHAHADALSVEVRHDGVDILLPGDVS